MEPLRRDLGPQPIAALMEREGLSSAALVSASTEQLTHKMVTRACKGRRLTANTQKKVQRALETALGRSCELSELFDYR